MPRGPWASGAYHGARWLQEAQQSAHQNDTEKSARVDRIRFFILETTSKS